MTQLVTCEQELPAVVHLELLALQVGDEVHLWGEGGGDAVLSSEEGDRDGRGCKKIFWAINIVNDL